MASKRETAVAEMEARLRTITTANGYNTNAGLDTLVMEHVSEGPGDAAAMVHLYILDDAVTPEQLEHVVSEITFIVSIITKVDTPWRTVEAAIADVKRAVEQSDRTLNGALVPRGLRRGTTKPHPREDGSIWVGAEVEYHGTLAEVWGAP